MPACSLSEMSIFGTMHTMRRMSSDVNDWDPMLETLNTSLSVIENSEVRERQLRWWTKLRNDEYMTAASTTQIVDTCFKTSARNHRSPYRSRDGRSSIAYLSMKIQNWSMFWENNWKISCEICKRRGLEFVSSQAEIHLKFSTNFEWRRCTYKN